MVLRYFAYGSNLCVDQMTARTGPVRQGAGRRVAWLPNYELVFNMQWDGGQAFANLKFPGAGVFGMVYCCTPEAMLRMDVHEKGYARAHVRVVLENGKKINALTYLAEAEYLGSGSHPSFEYLQRILAGARQHGLPDEYIREIEKKGMGVFLQVQASILPIIIHEV